MSPPTSSQGLEPRASAFLPPIALFQKDKKPAIDALIAALKLAGFIDVRQAGDLFDGLSITPPGEPERVISPPGTDPERDFDVASVIMLIGGTIKGYGPAGRDARLSPRLDG
jgi:hypothetical protein